MKSRDVIFQEETFLGLGSVDNKTEEDWETWEIKYKHPPSSPIVQLPLSHNPSRAPDVITVSPNSSCPSTPPLSVPLADRFDQSLDASVHNTANKPILSNEVECVNVLQDTEEPETIPIPSLDDEGIAGVVPSSPEILCSSRQSLGTTLYIHS